MATAITFSAQDGPGSGFVLSGNEAAALVSDKYFWTRIGVSSGSPWAPQEYPGYDGMDGKFFGGKPNRFIISGFVVAATESALWNAVAALLNKNKTQTLWSFAGPITSTTGNGIILDISADTHGGDTEKKWPFQLVFSNLGV